MWDQLSPGLKRFMAWFVIFYSAGMLLFAIACVFTSDWLYVGLFALFGVSGIVRSRSQLRSIDDPRP